MAKPYLVKRVSWSQTTSILNYWYLQNLPKYVSTEAQKEILTLLLRIHELEIQNIEYQSQLYLREHDLSQKDFIISRYQNYRTLAEELISQQRELINGKLIVWFNVDHLVLKHLLHLWFTVLALNWWSENVGFIGIVCRMIHVHVVINQFSDRGFPSCVFKFKLCVRLRTVLVHCQAFLKAAGMANEYQFRLFTVSHNEATDTMQVWNLQGMTSPH